MTSYDQRPIAVIGATGQQGGSTIDALLAAGASVRAIVRDPDSAAARALQERGVQVVAGDQEDTGSLAQGLADVAALFFMTTIDGPDGADGEVRRGIAVAEAAARAGVPRVLYSSVGGAERGTGIPHFESKRQVEQQLSSLLPAQFLRPTFFMENLTPQLTPDSNGEIVLRLPLGDDVPLQMVAVSDIGATAAKLLLDPQAIDGNAVEIAGDEVTMKQVAALVQEITGHNSRFEEVPLDVLGEDADLKAMFRWFASAPSYQADMTVTRRLAPEARDVKSWLRAVALS